VLIVAESLRGARFTRTALVLAFVLAVVALVGNIRAFDGGEGRPTRSVNDCEG
jgi:hypothetical protein